MISSSLISNLWHNHDTSQSDRLPGRSASILLLRGHSNIMIVKHICMIQLPTAIFKLPANVTTKQIPTILAKQINLYSLLLQPFNLEECKAQNVLDSVMQQAKLQASLLRYSREVKCDVSVLGHLKYTVVVQLYPLENSNNHINMKQLEYISLLED